MSGAAGSRECTGSSSFSSVSNTPREVEEEFLQYHMKPLLGGSMEMMRDGGGSGDLQRVVGVPSEPLPAPPPPPPTVKKKRSLPGTPDPSAEVIALSPRTLMATNRFVCEICHKGFQRDQNLQLHRRGHNLPWKLRQRGGGPGGADGAGACGPPRKRVYVCPEASCVHHNPERALGDLTGIKKHYCRKHGEKKWKCERCAKRYAVHSDWKAHAKVCGTREYKCDCGTVFSRRDSFVTHRAFCDALAQENNKLSQPMNMATVASALQGQAAPHHLAQLPSSSSQPDDNFDTAGEDDDDFALDTKSPQLRMLPTMSDADADADVASPLLLPPLSMAGCMLSSMQQGAARPTPPPPPSPATFFSGGKAACLDDPSMGGAFSPAGASASMSATALLQKAAEMGATAGGYSLGVGAGFSTVGFGPMLGGPDNSLPIMGPFGPVKTPSVLDSYDGLPLGQTPLVGLNVGRLFPGQQFYGGSQSHGVGSMTRAIESLMHGGAGAGGGQMEHRRPDDIRVVDYLGVEDQRSCFSGVSPFGPHIGPWA